MYRKIRYALFLTLLLPNAYGQQSGEALTVQKIMQDPTSWIGTSPSEVQWSADGSSVYFFWNPDNNPGDSLYAYKLKTGKISKVDANSALLPEETPISNIEKTKQLYLRNGDLYERDVKNGQLQQLTANLNGISQISYAANGLDIYFTMGNNLIFLDRKKAILQQLTDIKQGEKESEKSPSLQESWLNQDQLSFFKVLQERKQKKEQREQQHKKQQAGRPLPIYIGEQRIDNQKLSPDGRYVTFRLIMSAADESTDVPTFVTESGYTETLKARAKVGGSKSSSKLGIYDMVRDTVYYLQTEALPGLDKEPDFFKDYPKKKLKRNQDVIIHGPLYPKQGGNLALLEIRSIDNKDRWIGLGDLATGKVQVLDHQRDEAWIGGPGIGWLFSPGDMGWLPDGKKAWFQSEASGYSHIYTVQADNGKKEQLTKGAYEVYAPHISNNGKYWYFHANKAHAGIRHFYRMPLTGGEPEQLTKGDGGWDVFLSPDEKWLAALYSSANQPAELYLQANRAGTTAKKLTSSTTQEWQQYAWRMPEFITFTASDGTQVPARLYKPAAGVQQGPAVIFVHGAGYLQNAHQWWSSYFREYMFHNLLVDKGYTVLDIDYRGSAGYGRDWRTAIYRHMGSKDLSDQIDGAKWLVKTQGVDSSRLGIYGGSYGGFITLMALFNEPGVFKAGAALRSVTDWAHYNHPYTANILNEPYTDSLAYARSSPLYYAEGLKDHLLIAHGMIDTNVHFQDVVRLSQRLIELGKENWELAVYPMEDHAFVEPSSWTDEYRRILKLFEETIGKENKKAAD